MRRSVRFLIPAALAWLAAACTDSTPPTAADADALSPSAAAAAARVDVRDRYIVVFNDKVARPGDEAREVVDAHGGTLHFVYENALRGFAATLSPKAVEALRKNPKVRYVEPDGIATLTALQTGAPWGLDRIDQRALPLNTTYGYESATTGSGVNAYIIDSGIRFTHTQFGGRAVPGADFINDGQNGNDCWGHGTHVAGIVGGSTYGVAKSVKLISVRVVSCTNSTSTSAVVAGLDWILLNHVKPAVVNLSLTTTANLAMDDAAKALLAANVTVVSAAGNSNLDVCNFSSAYISGVITVGATDATDTRWPSSNYGYCMDVFAPGVDIPSAAYSGDTDTGTLTGTSMAAPHVTGAVARYLQTTPSATPTQTHAFIVNQATPNVVTNPGNLSPNRLLFANRPVTTNITGPTSIATAGTYTWQSNGAGGNGSYTYRWEYRTQGSATWTQVGTAASYSRSVAAGNAPFELRVTVTSAGVSATDASHLVAANISTAPTANITGPTAITTAGTYTWQANAAGGSGTYTYSWEYRVQGAATWTAVGTAASYSRSVAAGAAAFELRVTVTSGGLTGSDPSHLVSVNIPVPLSANITGPAYLDGGMSGTWYANAAGGAGAYTYQWQYQNQGSTTWSSVVGTASSYTRTVPLRGLSFTLRVTVTSGTGSVVDTHFVEVYAEPIYTCDAATAPATADTATTESTTMTPTVNAALPVCP